MIATGKPLVEFQKDGARIGVVLPLHDKARHTIGALGLMYMYYAGEDQAAFLNRSQKIRDQVSKEIASKDVLFLGK